MPSRGLGDGERHESTAVMAPADDDPRFIVVRESFPALRHMTYLNAGSVGPLSRATTAAMSDVARDELERGRDGPGAWDRMLNLRARTREAFATLINTEPSRVALTLSTAHGCALAVIALELSARDEVITTDCEHPGLLQALEATSATLRIAAVKTRAAEEAYDAVLKEIRPRTRLIALSHVAWTTGQRLPIHEIKAATGIPLLVDGAQAAGAIPVHPGDIDFYAMPSQKWLCGPDAVGALYIAHPEAWDNRHVSPPDGLYHPRAVDASGFDSGWIPAPHLAGSIQAIGSRPTWAYDRARQTTDQARRALKESGISVRTEADQSTLIAFSLDEDPAATLERTRAHQVDIRDLPGTPWLRASVGYWTNLEDIGHLLSALARST